MNDVAQLKALLAKVEAIGIKHAGVAEKEQYDFNVFSILRKEHEEVGLHSAFLKALFDPKGGHGQGVWMLNRFLKKVGIDPLKEEANVQVVREYTKLRPINNGTERTASTSISDPETEPSSSKTKFMQMISLPKLNDM